MTVIAEPQPLTKKQTDIYAWIVAYIESHGYSPTVREICKAFKFASPQGAHCHLRPLRKKGWVTWTDGASRTIRPTEVSHETV
jgi:SOS-response transcriptional repressor LexA